MIIKTFKPIKLLEKFIEDISIVKTTHAITKDVLPNTAVTLSIRLSGYQSYMLNSQNHISLPEISVIGIRKGLKSIYLSQGTETLLIRFKAGAAASFFKMSIHDFFETHVSIEAIYPFPIVEKLRQEIAHAENAQLIVDKLQVFLLSQLIISSKDLLIEVAVDKIRDLRGKIRIRQLSNELNISMDAFEKTFRKTVGTTPKHFCSIIKMKHAVDMIGLQRDLTPEIVFSLGYFDQTHFINDFKLFTGQTPLAYIKSVSKNFQVMNG